MSRPLHANARVDGDIFRDPLVLFVHDGVRLAHDFRFFNANGDDVGVVHDERVVEA